MAALVGNDARLNETMSTHAVVPEARMVLQWQAAEFLSREAKLLDDAMIKEWHALFTADCQYWIPIDENAPRGQSVSLVNDNAIALDERIYHLLSTTFAAQTPKSRTLHFITNVVVEPGSDDPLTVHSNQLIMELRTGDYRQVGLGLLRPLAAAVDHVLVRDGNDFKIKSKVIRLIDREMPQGNLTFLL
jgi:ethylbenzene dioxygenase subunit beta